MRGEHRTLAVDREATQDAVQTMPQENGRIPAYIAGTLAIETVERRHGDNLLTILRQHKQRWSPSASSTRHSGHGDC